MHTYLTHIHGCIRIQRHQVASDVCSKHNYVLTLSSYFQTSFMLKLSWCYGFGLMHSLLLHMHAWSWGLMCAIAPAPPPHAWPAAWGNPGINISVAAPPFNKSEQQFDMYFSRVAPEIIQKSVNRTRTRTEL